MEGLIVRPARGFFRRVGPRRRAIHREGEDRGKLKEKGGEGRGRRGDENGEIEKIRTRRTGQHLQHTARRVGAGRVDLPDTVLFRRPALAASPLSDPFRQRGAPRRIRRARAGLDLAADPPRALQTPRKPWRGNGTRGARAQHPPPPSFFHWLPAPGIGWRPRTRPRFAGRTGVRQHSPQPRRGHRLIRRADTDAALRRG